MKRIVSVETARWIRPNPWQMCLIGLCALILCSCRGPLRYDRSMVAHNAPPGLPQEAYAGAAGVPNVPPIGPSGMSAATPVPAATPSIVSVTGQSA